MQHLYSTRVSPAIYPNKLDYICCFSSIPSPPWLNLSISIGMAGGLYFHYRQYQLSILAMLAPPADIIELILYRAPQKLIRYGRYISESADICNRALHPTKLRNISSPTNYARKPGREEQKKSKSQHKLVLVSSFTNKCTSSLFIY